MLLRVLAVLSAVLTLASIIFNNLLYLPGLVVGLVTVLLFRRLKPKSIRPYFYIALVATIVAFIVFVVEGILGFVFFINS